MEMSRYEHGVPSWVELGTTDIDRAVEFYSSLFGWEVPEGQPETAGYRVAHLRGKTVAGLSPQMAPDAPPAWTTYVDVESAEATTQEVTANGGSVFVSPMDVMDIGRMAICADPTGAVFGLWQAGTFTGAQLVNEPGAFCWNELLTTDTAKAAAFYKAVFGWDAQVLSDGAYTEWKLGGRVIGGMMAKPDTMPAEVPPSWGVYFAVADTDVTVSRATELGASVMLPATDIEPGRFAVLADPMGGAFSVIAMKEELAQS
jgi:predicted enzyme related to lactoylglutathione lyase